MSMPSCFWSKAVATAVFLLSCSPTKALDGLTWHEEKPPVQFLRVLGYVGHMNITKPHAKKLDDRSVLMVFLGYEDGGKTYKVFEHVYVTRDVILDEELAELGLGLEVHQGRQWLHHHASGYVRCQDRSLIGVHASNPDPDCRQLKSCTYLPTLSSAYDIISWSDWTTSLTSFGLFVSFSLFFGRREFTLISLI